MIEFFDKKEYIYITLANLADISNGSEKKIALPNPENLAVLDLECLVELQYVEYCLKDDLERISQHTHIFAYLFCHFPNPPNHHPRGCLQTQAIQTRMAASRVSAKNRQARFSYLVAKRR